MARDPRVIRNPISVIGMVVTTISAVLFLVVFLADLFGLHTNPYIGILFFLLLPALFLAGLALIPLGTWHARRRQRAGKPLAEVAWPRIDLNDPTQRRRAVLVFTLTMANVVIVALAAYRGVEYMDSVQFCGQVCHTVMKPEFTAHKEGAHSRLACVECHIGSGATSFVQAKVSGLRQLVSLSRGTYARPIAAPVRNLRPARDICETCHSPRTSHGDVVRRFVEYDADETNTETVNTLQLHVGGGTGRAGSLTGIHWHADPAHAIDYIATDDKRQVIPYVRIVDASGQVREYLAPNVTPAQLAQGERRRMDCLDCHNRPSHPIAATPERAVNEAIMRGDISRTLPFIRRETVKALSVSYQSQQAAVDGMARGLRDFYRTTYPTEAVSRRDDIEQAVTGASGIYRRNVFPEMRVQFGSYPNNIGHTDFPGCFRCHDDEHATRDGKKIGQECDTCHEIQ